MISQARANMSLYGHGCGPLRGEAHPTRVLGVIYTCPQLSQPTRLHNMHWVQHTETSEACHGAPGVVNPWGSHLRDIYGLGWMPTKIMERIMTSNRFDALCNVAVSTVLMDYVAVSTVLM